MPFRLDVVDQPGTSSSEDAAGGIEEVATHHCAPYQFAFECAAPNCCASYHQRFLMLLGSLAIFAMAILVLLIWMSLQWRPRYWRRRAWPNKRMSEVELKSCEETRYLRRMSELNPNIQRESGTN